MMPFHLEDQVALIEIIRETVTQREARQWINSSESSTLIQIS